MNIQDLLSQIEADGISEATKKKHIQQLQDFIKSCNKLHAGHRPTTIDRLALIHPELEVELDQTLSESE